MLFYYHLFTHITFILVLLLLFLLFIIVFYTITVLNILNIYSFHLNFGLSFGLRFSTSFEIYFYSFLYFYLVLIFISILVLAILILQMKLFPVIYKSMFLIFVQDIFSISSNICKLFIALFAENIVNNNNTELKHISIHCLSTHFSPV